MTGKQGLPTTQEAGALAARGPRLLLVDPRPAPRRVLAGQLAAHVGAPKGRAVVTESATVAAAVRPCPPLGPLPWDAAVIAVADEAEGRAAVAGLRAVGSGDGRPRLPLLPVLLLMPLRRGGGTAADWPPAVARVDRPPRLSALLGALGHLLDDAAAAARSPAPVALATGTGSPSDAGREPDPVGLADDAALSGMGAPFDLGPYTCDPGQRLLTQRATGQALPLTEKEAAILSRLHAAAAPLSRDALLHGVWGYAGGVSTHTLETHIHRLRRKIEPDPRRPTLLLTDGGGYRLAGG